MTTFGETDAQAHIFHNRPNYVTREHMHLVSSYEWDEGDAACDMLMKHFPDVYTSEGRAADAFDFIITYKVWGNND